MFVSRSTAEFEVKSRHKSVEKTKPKHLLCITSVIFRSNKVRLMLETHSTKATAVGKSSNTGVPTAEPDSKIEKVTSLSPGRGTLTNK